MKNFVYIFFLLMCFSALSFSKGAELTTGNKKAQKLFFEAKDLLELSDIEQGEKKLNEAIKLDSNFLQAWITLKNIYVYTKKYDKSIKACLKILKLDPNNVKTQYDYSFSLYGIGNYKNAKTFLEKSTNIDTSIFNKKAQFLKKCLDFSIKSTENNVPVMLNKMEGINSDRSENTPTLTVDQQTIIYTIRNKKGNSNSLYINDEQEDLFVSYKKDGKWSVPKSLTNKINTLEGNEGAQTLSSDGRTLYFTSAGRKDCLGKTDIFVSRKVGNDWSEPENVGPPVSSQYWESQPCISNDGKTLYFVSDRPGGLGKSDIWYSELDSKGKWQEPINIGAPINTPEIEYTPFLHYDNRTLFFASDGQVGLGGLDLFVTKKDENGKWSEPKNLGYPINDASQQLGLFVASDGKTAYYGIDKTNNNSDLFSFILPQNLQAERISFIKGKVFDSHTKAGLKTQIRLIDAETKKEILSSQSETWGDFLISLPSGRYYTLEVKKDDYFAYSKNFFLDSYFSKSDEAYSIDIPLTYKKEEIEVQFIFSNKITNEKVQASFAITNKSNNELFYEAVSNDNGSFKVKLEKSVKYGLKAKAKGFDDYSMDIAQKASKYEIALSPVVIIKNLRFNIVNSVTKQSIEAESIKLHISDSAKNIEGSNGIYKLNVKNQYDISINKSGYAEYKVSRLMISPDKDTSELVIMLNPNEDYIEPPKIVETPIVKQDTLKNVEIVEVKDIEIKKEPIVEKVIVKQIAKPVFVNVKIPIVVPIKLQTFDDLKDIPIPKKKIVKIEKPRVIESVKEPVLKSDNYEFQFGFGKSEIGVEGEKVLDNIVALYKSNDKIKIRLEGHSNKVGNSKYNMYLSKIRVNAMLNYLVSRGVDKSVIEVKWYGDTMPKYENLKKNRRGEIHILK